MQPGRKTKIPQSPNIRTFNGFSRAVFLMILILPLVGLGLGLFRNIFTLLLSRVPWEIKTEPAPEQILYQPSSTAAHLALARQFLRLNNPQHALEEIAIAKTLGASKEQINQIHQEAQDMASLQELITSDRRRWQNLIATRSNYRDGWYQIAVLSWFLGDDQEVIKNLQEALKIDPNFKPAQELLKLVTKN